MITLKENQRNRRLADLPAWQREEVRRYRRLCELVHARMQKGESLNKAVQHFVRLYRGGRPFRCDPSRVFKFSLNTLLRKYAAWLRNPTTEALVKGNFWPRRTTPPVTSIRRALLSRCLEPGVESIADVLRRFEADWRSGRIPGSAKGRPVPYSPRHLRRILTDALGPGGLHDLRRYFDQERKARRQFGCAQAMVAKGIASMSAEVSEQNRSKMEGSTK